MNEKKRLLKNTGLIALGNFGAKMISFLLLPLYTSILTTDEYGTYDFIVALGAFLLPIVTISMYEAMFRFVIDTEKKEEEFKKIVTNAFATVFFGIVLFGVFCCIVYRVFNIHIILYVWIYVTASALYTFSNNLLRGMGKLKEYAVISSTKNIMQLILNVFVVAIFRWGMEGLLFSMCMSEMMAFFIVCVIAHLWESVEISCISIQQIREMVTYSLPLIPNALCAQVINVSDRLIISTFLGAEANGIYSVSYKFPNMIETVYHYFYTAWSESASRVWKEGRKKAEKYYCSLLTMVNNVMFSAIVLMISGMPILFRIFVRGDYVKGFDYIPMLMFAMYFDSLAKFYSGIFTALKKTKIMAWSTLCAAIVNIAINLLFIKRFGLYAAAGSTLLADIVLVVIRSRALSKEMNFFIERKNVLIQLSVAMIVLFLFDYNNIYKISCGIFIAVLYAIIANRGLWKSIRSRR